MGVPFTLCLGLASHGDNIRPTHMRAFQVMAYTFIKHLAQWCAWLADTCGALLLFSRSMLESVSFAFLSLPLVHHMYFQDFTPPKVKLESEPSRDNLAFMHVCVLAGYVLF